MSGVGYGLSILFLSDEERGTLTAFLFASYLVVAASFAGKNTLLAHWTRGEFAVQMKIARRLARPGIYLGLVVALFGVILIFQAPGSEVGFFVLVTGAFIFLNTLSEALAAAKISSTDSKNFWQHYVFMLSFLLGFMLLAAISRATGLGVLVCYTIASIPFLTALAFGKSSSREEILVEFPPAKRLDASKLFADTLSGSMRIRVAGLIIAATSGPEILGQYLVLWVGFEVLDQLLKMGLLTRMYADQDLTDKESSSSAKQREQTFLRQGLPIVFVVTAMSIFLGSNFTTADSRDIVVSSALLAFAYGLRGPVNIRQSAIRASGHLGKSAAISVGDAVITSALVSILPIFFGFSGVALGLAISSVAALIIVTISAQPNGGGALNETNHKPVVVSVVMPAKNAEKTICQSIESVRKQDWGAWELIVIDDGSTDRTPELAALYESIDRRIHLVRNPSSLGTGPSRLRAVEIARGEIVAFLDADDVWLPSKLSEGIHFMQTRNASWIHTAHRSIRPSGKVGVKIGSRRVKGVTTLQRRNIIINSTVMVNKNLLPEKLSFEFTFAQDMELWLHLASTGLSCEYYPGETTLYRISRQSLSGDKIFAATRHWSNLSKVQANLAKRIANYFFYIVSASLVFLARKVPCVTCSGQNEYLRVLQREADDVVTSAPIEERL